VLLVSFHGGSGGETNVVAIAEDGKSTQEILSPAPPAGAELRGLAIAPDGKLWVANGSKDDSTITAYEWSSSSNVYVSAGTVVAYPAAEALWHPFDLTFSADGGSFYVSNQDTNVVACYADPGGQAAQLPSVLQGGTFLAGTFVASACGELPGVRRTTAVKTSDGGLAVTCEVDEKCCCKITHSVRGVLATNGALYVADEAGGAVRVYDGKGKYLGHVKLAAPVHLVEWSGTLYASATGGVFVATLDPAHPESLEFAQLPKMPKDASGIAFDPTPALYVASRKGRTITRYVVGSSKHVPSWQVDTSWKSPSFHDDLEFLLYVSH
jgi:hypothetical protein